MRIRAIAAALGILSLAAMLQGADLTVERSFASVAEFDTFFRDPAIDIFSAPGAVTLRPDSHLPGPAGNKLAGGIYGSVRLSTNKLARKTFTLPAGAAAGAEIFAFPGGAGEALVNGKPVRFGPFPHHGGWTRAEVPAALLKAGLNELVFGPGLVLTQDRETKPVTSFFSTDGGARWTSAEGGEFLVHIRLLRPPARGVITSPVIDMAASSNDVIVPLFLIRQLTVEWRAIVPSGSAVTLEARSGSTPWPDNGWAPWSRSDRVAPGRFVQVRATLQAGEDRTPTLTRLSLTAKGEVLADPASQGLRLVSFLNPPLVRPSQPYGFQRPSTKLKRLREEYRLDEVVAAGRTDLEKALLLRNWARARWTCNDAGSAKRTWDALEILGAPEGQRGMCVHFATVFYQCALALGFNARPVILTGHYVADIWCREEGKWVLMDVESVQPEGFRKHGTAHYLEAATRRPLGALELHRAVVRAMAAGVTSAVDVIQVYAMDGETGPVTVTEATRGPDSGLSIFRSLAYPPRNDYLDKLDPWEEMHGENHYHSDDYLWWRTAPPFERDAHYTKKTDRAGDFDWTVHTPHLVLTATETPGEIRVVADTVTPNLQSFRFAPAGRDPVLLPGAGDDPDSRRAAFLWRLEPGANTLSVTTLNTFGREGRAARVEVEWSPREKP